MNGGHLLLGLVALVALIGCGLLWQALIGERANHAATRYDLGAAWSAYDAVRAVHEEAVHGVVELRMPTAVEEYRALDHMPPMPGESNWIAVSREAARSRHPAGRALRAVGGGGA